ncbi:MAG: hypothetical protein MUE73_17715 [Planctomycetes bacterium]|jgi:hypothetical protein|nr:hypothetical protein [Planctomycetota bacterium]
MPRAACLSLFLLSLLLPAPVRGQEEPAAQIEWVKDLSAALAKAKETGKILLICVNAKVVEGERGEEPAAKGLREVVYRDPRIVSRSRAFVCSLVSPNSSVADHGVLGNLGVMAPIISPQHIFVSPEGDRVLHRLEYWPHGKGDKAVEALLAMMKEAEEALAAPKPPAEPTAPPVEGAKPIPPTDEARAQWIADLLSKVRDVPAERGPALKALVKEDREGDCTGPLIKLLGETKKDTDFLRLLIRALGRDKLFAAALPVAAHLGHREDRIRAEAAVSLEYIGCRDRKVIAELTSATGREKDELLANHAYRALGRCGVEDAGTRALLLKMAANGKSEFATYGPAMGLAYFERDEKAARGVEKILKLVGLPGGGRGAGQNTMKRVLLSWTLAEIGEPKSEDFVRDELILPLQGNTAFWVEGMLNFWEAVARTCAGEDEMAAVEGGVKFTVGIALRFGGGRDGGTSSMSMMDEARRGREDAGFTPKGDGLTEGEGGGPGGPGGGPGGRPGGGKGGR